MVSILCVLEDFSIKKISPNLLPVCFTQVFTFEDLSFGLWDMLDNIIIVLFCVVDLPLLLYRRAKAEQYFLCNIMPYL